MLIYLSVLETDYEKHEFMALYAEYHAVMLRVAKKYFPTDQMAREDAVQNAWMKIVKSFQKISAIECKKRGAYCVISINGNPGQLYSSATETQSSCITWIDTKSNICFFIDGFLSDDELIYTAQNVSLISEDNFT